MDDNLDKKNYEISFLLKNKEDVGVIESLLKRYGAEMLYKGPVVEKRLAYPIKKYSIAHFSYFQFKASPDVVEKVMQSIKLNSSVIRSLLIKSPIIKESRYAYNKNNNVEDKPLHGQMEMPEKNNVSQGGMLSNEALEETLEKMLK